MKTQILNLLTNSLRGQTTRKGISIPSVSLLYPYRKMAVILFCLLTLGIGQVWAEESIPKGNSYIDVAKDTAL